jgi:hypothetical protein
MLELIGTGFNGVIYKVHDDNDDDDVDEEEEEDK